MLQIEALHVLIEKEILLNPIEIQVRIKTPVQLLGFHIPFK